MNSWRSRILVCAVFLLAMQIHAVATESLPNTPEGMLLFHGSAFTVDVFLIWFVSHFIEGRLCDYTQFLCTASIVANFLGWLAYLAYAPPVFYNTFMWALSYVQWGILLLVDHHDADHLGFAVVRGYRSRRHQLYS